MSRGVQGMCLYVAVCESTSTTRSWVYLFKACLNAGALATALNFGGLSGGFGVQAAAMLSQQPCLLETAVQLEGSLDGLCVWHSVLVL